MQYIIMDNQKKDFARRLLKIKAIKLQPNDPFTWASGWKEWQASQVQASTGYLGFSYREGTLELSHFKETKGSLLLA